MQPFQEVEYPTAHVAIANGDATFLATHWNPLHADYYKNAGGDAKLFRKGVYSDNAAQGYLIDKKTADEYKITNIGQLKDPKIAKLFRLGRRRQGRPHRLHAGLGLRGRDRAPPDGLQAARPP